MGGGVSVIKIWMWPGLGCVPLIAQYPLVEFSWRQLMAQCGWSLSQGPRGHSGMHCVCVFLSHGYTNGGALPSRILPPQTRPPQGLVWSCSLNPWAWSVSRVGRVWRWRAHCKYWLGPKKIGIWLTNTPLLGWSGNGGNLDVLGQKPEHERIER